MSETDPQTGVTLSGRMPTLRVDPDLAPSDATEQASADTVSARSAASSAVQPPLGLSSVEAEARRAQGLGNEGPSTAAAPTG